MDKQLTRTIGFLDSAVEDLVEFNLIHQIPDKIFNKLTSAIAILENQLRFRNDDDRYEEIDLRKTRYEDTEED